MTLVAVIHSAVHISLRSIRKVHNEGESKTSDVKKFYLKVGP